MRRPALPGARLVPAALVAAAMALPALPALPAHAAARPAPAPAAVRSAPAQKATLHRGDLAPAGTGSRPGLASSASSVTPSLVPGVPGPAVSTWRVTYSGFSPQAQAAFQRAVDLWAGIVRSPVPITVDATMMNLGDPTLLGQTGPSNFYAGGGVGDGTTYYPSALADALARRDVGPGDPDIISEFNTGAAGLYYGTDGNPGAGQIDFETVVLHELGHGLGVIGSMDVSDTTRRGSFEAPPDIYDQLVFGSTGQPLVNETNDSTALAAQLQSGQVTWSGARAARRNAGVRPRLYAPSTWQPGSSYAHLDEATYGRGNPESLMTPVLTSQEVIRDPGSIMRGMFADMGWSVVAEQAERGTWSSSAGSVDVAERRADGSLAMRTLTSAGLSQPELLGGLVRSAPAVIRRPSGGLEVYVRGGDDQLYTRRRDTAGTWSDWVGLGGILSGPPSVALFRGDEVHVFVRGGDGATYHRWSGFAGSFGGWESLGGVLRADTGPAAYSPASGNLELVVQGTDRQAYRKTYAGGWSGFAPLGGQIEGTPAVAAPGGSLLAVVRGADSIPYTRTASTGWAPLGGVLAGSPSMAAVPGSNRADVYATGTDGALYRNTVVSGAWSGWSAV